MVVFVIIIVLLLIIAALGFFTVEQQRVAVVERFGKFLRLAEPGLHIRVPLIDRIAARMSLQVEQLELAIETKTKDNVFVTVEVAIQYRVDNVRVREAFYLLDKPRAQMEAESKHLQGEGIAAQRKAIMGGLRESVETFTAATGVSADEAMRLVTLTGYTDMLRDVASASETNTILIPHSPSGLTDLIAALRSNDLIGDASTPPTNPNKTV
jgi:regulator of protease activity HflC (stomatin/prohibitin superfamily)